MTLTDPGSIQAPNRNKTLGAAAGVAGGGFVGMGAVALIHLYFKVEISPEWASAIAFSATGAAAVVGAFLAPIFTAGQQAMIRHLNSIDRANAEAFVQATVAINDSKPK